MQATPQNLANAIRVLSMDAVQKANSGHPGMPMGMADIGYVLWHQFLQHNPKNPNWPNRDRFIISNGHGSMLHYALLHLTGYDLSLDEIKNFRQLHSKTPGHPEYGETPGIETTTGPLGQGLANAVGMAIAETILRHTFNEENYPIIDHYTYAFAGDGCMMEGISHEACSLAGTLGLGKLIVFYDDNGISIDGDVSAWFKDDTAMRFKAYNWQVISIDGHDFNAIRVAISKAQAEKEKPTLIICKTIIGYGSPHLSGSEKVHGAPLGDDEIANTRKALDWPYPPFEIPKQIYRAYDACDEGCKKEQAWEELFKAYEKQYPLKAEELKRRLNDELPTNFAKNYQDKIAITFKEQKSLASRKSSEMCLNVLAQLLPELIGGSADLTGSNNTKWKEAKALTKTQRTANYIYYGVREFAMSAIINGIALYGGFIPFAGTFLVFSDYAKNAIRLAALIEAHSIFVLTHDSIGLGEDGPTHQPIEQIAMLRMTPNLKVWRPCDNIETAAAWQAAIEHNGPSCLLLSRQNLPVMHQNLSRYQDIQKGAYILADSEAPRLILIATGSEVSIAIDAYKQLKQHGIDTRVVSMPCVEQFLSQEKPYIEAVLPKGIKRIAIEAGAKDYWYKFVGLEGAIIGLDQFGLSAPKDKVFDALNMTSAAVVEAAFTLIEE